MRSYPAKKQTLRMADGGMMRWAKNIMQPNRLQAAEAAALAPPPVVAAPPPPPPPNPNATPDNPAGIKFADGGYHKGSLRGGRVHGPGDGTVDTVKAEYANGEYVLPTDTAQAIGYDKLDAIKDATHTPVAEQRGQTLRMVNGGIPGLSVSESPFTTADEKLFNTRAPGAVAPAQPVLPGATVTETPMSRADAKSFVRDPGVGNANVGAGGSEQARTFRSTQPGAVGPMPPQGFKPPVPESLTSRVGSTLRTGGGAVGNFARSVGAAGLPLAVGAEAANVASTGTEEYAQRLGATAGQSLGSDLAIRAAGGMADVGNALTFGLADRVGNLVAGNGFNRSPSTATLRPPVTPVAAPAPANPAATLSPGDATMPGQDPGRITLRGQAGADVYGAPGVAKFTQNGKTLYSNVAGPDNDKLMAGGGGVSTVPGMSRAEIDATLGGKSVGQTTADNAIRAANLRDGVDMERGITGSPDAEMRKLAMSPLGTPGRSFAQKQLSENAQNAITLRGQDLTYGSAISGQQSTAKTAANAARIDQMNKDRTFQMDVAKFGEDQAKNNFDQRQKAQKDLHDEIGGMLPTGLDGKPDMNNAARYATALNADLAAKQTQLQAKAKGGDAQAAAALADLQKNGHAALGEGYKRTFINGMKVKDLAEQYHSGGTNPFGGTAVMTDQAPNSLRKTKDGLFGFGETYADNLGNVIPARAVEGDGSFFGGKRRTDLNSFIQK